MSEKTTYEEGKDALHTCQYCGNFEEKGILMQHKAEGHIAYGCQIGKCQRVVFVKGGDGAYRARSSNHVVFSDESCKEGWKEKTDE